MAITSSDERENFGVSNSWIAVSFDCADARAVAEFWATATGRHVADDASTAEHVVLPSADDAAGGPTLIFNSVPEPKTVKNRVHIDLATRTFDAEAERLVSLGGRKLAEHEQHGSHWATFADVEGNEFDLIAR
jgi:predicted enzyme related to lactoylglutathione lyase